jgi:anthranilate phosphoribosyltransferase
MIREAIGTILEGTDLDEDRAAGVMGEIMDGAASPALVAAYLVALRAKGEAVSEIIGSARAMRRKALAVSLGDLVAVDLCGTGGDGRNTFNISTTATFVTAGAGVPVAKHGNRAASSRSGSADLLQALGADLSLGPAQALTCLRRSGVGFFFAPTFHPAMKNVAGVRRELGLRTVFNLLGPLTNPAGVRVQLLGVCAPGLVEPLARALGRLGATCAYVVHGEGGFDEATTVAPCFTAFLAKGRVVLGHFDPADLGLARARPQDLAGGTPQENAEITLAVLRGESGPRRDTVVLNAALALRVSGRARNLTDGLHLAQRSIDEGRALRSLTTFVAATKDLGGGAP